MTVELLHAADAVAVFYMIGSENVTNVCPYKQHEPQHKYSLGEGVSGLIYNKKYRVSIQYVLLLIMYVRYIIVTRTSISDRARLRLGTWNLERLQDCLIE